VQPVLDILLFDNPPCKVEAPGTIALVANAHFDLFRIQQKYNLYRLGGLALVAMFDRIIDGFTNRKLEVFDALGRKPDRLTYLVGAGAHDALEHWV
jgi:hypothetical protein